MGARRILDSSRITLRADCRKYVLRNKALQEWNLGLESFVWWAGRIHCGLYRAIPLLDQGFEYMVFCSAHPIFCLKFPLHGSYDSQHFYGFCQHQTSPQGIPRLYAGGIEHGCLRGWIYDTGRCGSVFAAIPGGGRCLERHAGAHSLQSICTSTVTAGPARHGISALVRRHWQSGCRFGIVCGRIGSRSGGTNRIINFAFTNTIQAAAASKFEPGNYVRGTI
mmetsp:Transcript_21608/g.44431  ORF Transcript_21608/g.44431 Transcript_21608/m.44431 type:complete len:222 (+) Transcript_21608:860-1525(+)